MLYNAITAVFVTKHPVNVGGAASTATRVLGGLIAQNRRQRGWTASRLADAIGVTPRTVAHIESGRPTVAIGTVFEAAAILGVRLFEADRAELQRLLRDGQDRLALLPQRVRPKDEAIDDDF